ncbi:helix-turn-helix transcriptional regulator [Brevundimonas sp.]|uniref:helix-turn-helix domain-containing protein n=1 Tax=Brevundimonas sp. TaxID=1871086 RepID=UPI002487BAD0|nr:helix-turn-helix transcriptional regulator [Brevundimonas sp.]MDI1281731.1 helix-turn-helix transcriptional regulator [Brevundimonas sp.]
MDPAERQSQSETLSSALRLIRAHRRMKSAEVAEAMGMAQRSYEHFEAGGGRINLERIHRFAEVTDSDPYAILAALALGSPRFALRSADNKLMTILTVALQEFDETLGDVIVELDARTLINAFTRTMKDLALQAVRRDSAAQDWLETRVAKLVTPAGGEDEGGAGNSRP